MQNIITDFIAIAALILSITSLILSVHFASVSTMPSIEIKIDKLPPYETTDEKSIVRIRNVGNCIAKIEEINILYSWIRGETFQLKTIHVTIFPQEPIVIPYRFRLPDSPGEHTIRIDVKVSYKFIILTKETYFVTPFPFRMP